MCSGRINVLDAELQVPGAVFVAKPYAPEMVGRILADAAKAGHVCTPDLSSFIVRRRRGRETVPASGCGNRRR